MARKKVTVTKFAQVSFRCAPEDALAIAREAQREGVSRKAILLTGFKLLQTTKEKGGDDAHS
jgi:hypothetical protein